MKASYEAPTVQTLQAHRIVEMMGPVSCGSGSVTPMPEHEFGTFNSGGKTNFSR